MMSSALSRQKITDLLTDSDISVAVFDSLPSTNDYAAGIAKDSGGTTLIVTPRQTAGRGTKGRGFFSEADEGLYLSLLLHPDFAASLAMLATPAAAVAVCRAIQNITGVSCGIKWVNDIVINDKKLCGILTESRLSGDGKRLQYLIIGIGINVRVARFPADIAGTATSLDRHSDTPVDRNVLCATIVNELMPLLASIEDRQFLAEYRTWSSLLGRTVLFEKDGRQLVGAATAINDDGNLIIDVKGISYTLISGDVSVKLQ